MRGYDRTTYGRAFADVYDDWYAGISDPVATLDELWSLVPDGRPCTVVELGVGTGRLAIPLARRADETRTAAVVWGVDSSDDMLAVLRRRDPDGLVTVVCDDMVRGLAAARFDAPVALAVIAYNTLFNLLTETEQQACFDTVAETLEPGGRFVVESFVPAGARPDEDHVALRSMSVDRVVLSVSRELADQRTDGHLVELTDGAPVRLRPWSIRWATVEQIDAMAATAGLELERRTGGFGHDRFDDDDPRHVSIYRRPA